MQQPTFFLASDNDNIINAHGSKKNIIEGMKKKLIAQMIIIHVYHKGYSHWTRQENSNEVVSFHAF